MKLNPEIVDRLMRKLGEEKMTKTKLFTYRDRTILAEMRGGDLRFSVGRRVLQIDTVKTEHTGEAGRELLRRGLDLLVDDAEAVDAGGDAATVLFHALPDGGDEFNW